jgi:hypothetical protein
MAHRPQYHRYGSFQDIVRFVLCKGEDEVAFALAYPDYEDRGRYMSLHLSDCSRDRLVYASDIIGEIERLLSKGYVFATEDSKVNFVLLDPATGWRMTDDKLAELVVAARG